MVWPPSRSCGMILIKRAVHSVLIIRAIKLFRNGLSRSIRISPSNARRSLNLRATRHNPATTGPAYAPSFMPIMAPPPPLRALRAWPIPIVESLIIKSIFCPKCPKGGVRLASAGCCDFKSALKRAVPSGFELKLTPDTGGKTWSLFERQTKVTRPRLAKPALVGPLTTSQRWLKRVCKHNIRWKIDLVIIKAYKIVFHWIIWTIFRGLNLLRDFSLFRAYTHAR